MRTDWEEPGRNREGWPDESPGDRAVQPALSMVFLLTGLSLGASAASRRRRGERPAGNGPSPRRCECCGPGGRPRIADIHHAPGYAEWLRGLGAAG